MTRIVFLLGGLLMLSMHAAAQPARQYSFRHFTTANGLASNFINSVSQDKEGFIWFATINGLQRYDGNHLRTFLNKPDDLRSIPADNIELLFTDKHQNLWIAGTNNKLGLFDTRSFQFHEVPVKGSHQGPSYIQRYFFTGAGGRIFLHEAGGSLYRYDSIQKCFVDANAAVPVPKGWRRARMQYHEKEGLYWIAADSGIVLYDPVTRHLNYRGYNPDRNKAIAQATDLRHALHVHANDKYLHLVTWHPRASAPELHRIATATGKKETYLLGKQFQVGYHEVSGIMEQSNGRVWVYGNPVLAEWTEGRQSFIPVPIEFRTEQSVRFDYLFAPFEDREHNVWLATDNGVFLFNPDAQLFNSFNLARPGRTGIEAPVQAIAEMPDGSLFVGCWGKGIYYYDKQLNPLPLPAPLQKEGDILSVWDMVLHEKTGKLWVGLQPGGLLVYDPKKNTAKKYEPPVINGKTVRQVVEDKWGNIWLSTQEGKVFKWNYEEAGGDPAKGYELVYKGGLVMKLHVDPGGFIWAGTQSQGLVKIESLSGRVLQTFTADDKEGMRLFSNSVYDMTQLDDSTMILASGCINIMNIRTGRIRFFGTPQGLPSNTVLSVQKDQQGIIWAGMLNGLCRVNLKKSIASYYDRRDGIVYDNFTRAGVEKLNNGRVVFFTDHNFLVFDPQRFFQATTPAAPTLTALQLEGRSLPLDSLRKRGEVRLNYDATSLAFEFSSLSFIQQKKIHYYFRLEGVDKEWIRLDDDNRVHYNYLPTGTFRFYVRSQNEDGLTGPESFSMPIIVQPPVWRSKWFYALVILVIGGGLFIIDRERRKRRHSLQQVRTQIAGNLHHEVETTLNNISMLSEIAKIRVGSNVEQSKDFIDQISRKSRAMMEAMDDVLWSIDPKNDSMQKALLRIKEFTDGLQSTHDTEIDLIVEKSVQELHVGMVLRHELFFFYKETLAFLVQQHGCKQVFVHLKKKKGSLIMELLAVCNWSERELAAPLRAQVSERVRAINGSLDIVPEKNSLSVVLQVEV